MVVSALKEVPGLTDLEGFVDTVAVSEVHRELRTIECHTGQHEKCSKRCGCPCHLIEATLE